MKILQSERMSWIRVLRCAGSSLTHNGCYLILQVDKEDLFKTTCGQTSGSSKRCASFECIQCFVHTVTDYDGDIDALPNYEEWEMLQVNRVNV